MYLKDQGMTFSCSQNNTNKHPCESQHLNPFINSNTRIQHNTKQKYNNGSLILTFPKQTEKRSRRKESSSVKRKRSRHNNNLTISLQHEGVKCDKRKFNCKGHFSPSHPITVRHPHSIPLSHSLSLYLSHLLPLSTKFAGHLLCCVGCCLSLVLGATFHCPINRKTVQYNRLA